MKRLLILIFVAFVAWNAWKYWPTIAHRQPYHEAVVANRSGTTLERVRLAIGDQTFVKETLPNGEKAVFPFRVGGDATFSLLWQWSDRMGESRWSGGRVTNGPMVQRFTMDIDSDAGVIYRAESKEPR